MPRDVPFVPAGRNTRWVTRTTTVEYGRLDHFTNDCDTG